jgi:choline kinase
MKALILAAGQGRRLWPFTADRPKCLLLVGGASILEWQLRHLEQAGICQAVLVCGFGFEQMRAAVASYRGPLRLKLLYNPFYGVSDNLISLWVARAEMDEEFLLINGDNVFHPDILDRLLQVQEPCSLLACRKAAYDEDDMKLQLCGARLRRIGKDIASRETQAESVGIMRFADQGVEWLHQALSSYFVAGIQRLVEAGRPVHCCFADNLPCADVDTPADLHFVRQHLHLYQRERGPAALGIGGRA